MKEYCLTLWGWWARWFIHLGVLKLLEEKDIKLTEISWSSMWAVIWAMIAIWMDYEEITNMAKDLNFLKLVDIDFRTWLLKWNKIENKFKEIFQNKKIEDTDIPLKIVATNIETSEPEVFKSWKIVDALRASISLPWIFVPKEIDKKLYIDWWIMMNLPIEALDWNDIIAVSSLKLNAWKIIKEKKVFWIKFKTGFWKNNYEIIKRSVLSMMKVNEDNSIRTPWKNIQLIRPVFWDLDITNFWKLDEFINLGYNEARKVLK